MALPAKISDEQWRTVEPRIKELFQQHVPLRCKSGRRKTISEILQQDQGLTITVSQLEAKLREWNVAKKLRLSEWKLVMPRLDRLESKGIEYRLLLAGQEIKKTAIQRARRTLGGKTSADEPQAPGALQATNESQARQVSIMVRGDGDDWIPYESSEARMTREPSPRPTLGQESGLVPGDLAMPAPDADALDCVSPSALMQTAIIRHASHSGPFDSYAFDLHHFSSPNMQELCTPAVSGALASTALIDDFFDLGLASLHGTLPNINLASPSLSFLNSPVLTAWHGDPNFGGDIPTDSLSPISRPAFMHSPNLLHIILEHAARLAIPRSIGSSVRIARSRDVRLHPPLPAVEELMDRLLSLLPGKEAEQITSSGAAAADPGSTIRTALLNSIVNNFAGMQDIPTASILAALRCDAQMRSELFEHLRGSSQRLAKTIADNLFRTAVEACDVDAAKLLIAAGTGKPYAIQPNDIVCLFHDNTYTPLELAALHNSVDMVDALLLCGADPNLSRYIGRDAIKGKGALERAISGRVDMQLVQALIKHGAKVYSSFIGSTARHPEPGLLPALLGRLPATAHRELCERSLNTPSSREEPSPLVNIVECQSSEDAIAAVRLLIGLCAAACCGTCTVDYSDEFTRALVHAARYGNLELCRLLVQHKIKANALVLSAAIRGRRSDVVHFVLEQGVGFDEPASAVHVYPFFDSRYTTSEHAPTTPLAEAIRVHNHPLAKAFEGLGAWRMLRENASHFEAAANAAAEVNDAEYLARILAAGPHFPGHCLAWPLVGAIRGGNTQAAIILLDAGAGTDTLTHHNGVHHVHILAEAMKQRKKGLVYALLESDIQIDPISEPHTMEEVALWGDASLTKDLIRMGVDVNGGRTTTPLIEAVKSKNSDLIRFLLAKGANPNKKAILRLPPTSAFRVAINLADEESVDLFLSWGADPADEDLFNGGIKDGRSLKLLLTAFTSRHPRGLPGFGAGPLIWAVEDKNLGALDALLAAGMDPNGFYGPREYLRSTRVVTMTPLGFAIQHCGEDLTALRVLIGAGADVNCMAAMRTWGTSYTEMSVRIESALLVAIRFRKAAVAHLLLESGADVNHATRLGVKRTPLQAACEIGASSLVKLLLEWGADVDAPPARRGGGTALQLAAKGGYIRIVELLLSLGASVHAKPSRAIGRSALEGAAEHGRLKMLGVLWAAGGAGFPDDEIQRAIGYAEKGGHKGCADYIKWLWVTQAASRGLPQE
ncbi:hypothetical protein MAPG_09473 [Magnaporthiopsis poae ATCC 64411]|uniref:Clr5 domain-containing protein n=1 Tax=Magnaporthiopsis poae (strain ATCC 64411 / 73-15) TaxID=644358 RepID=A0A0C4EA19_MAGP6|nr:hypothetical protein MAPG_09473 [Magnaporthiopsis poae ATCC 64411]